MTAHESTNAHGDAHAAALLRSRQRAALAAWDAAVAAWRAEGQHLPWEVCEPSHARDAYLNAILQLQTPIVTTPALVAVGG